MTIKDRAIRYLKVRGWEEDPKDRSHYQAFTHPDKQNKAFVGVNGAVRVGACASKSFSVSESVWTGRQIWEKGQGFVEKALTY
jgi:hypothetical protein